MTHPTSSRLFTLSRVPAWRFVLWGLVGAVAVGCLAWLQDDPGPLFIFAPIVGLIMGLFGFFLQWTLDNSWAVRPLRWVTQIFIAIALIFLIINLISKFLN